MWDKKWVVGNWKMNGGLQANRELLAALEILPLQDKVSIGIAPPAVYLRQAAEAVCNSANPIRICAQDVSKFEGSGAYTGEVSAQMLGDVGVETVLVGHSERGLYFNEKNEVLRKKIENVLAAGLIPLLCVGESLQERENGREKEIVAAQLSVLKGLPTRNIAVAYEPVWAIGTGKVASTEQIAAMHSFIYREILSLFGEGANIRVLYGGSVNEGNAAEIFSVPHVDGALVGGASLKHDSFSAIIGVAQQA